jgi:hypothetical protein
MLNNRVLGMPVVITIGGLRFVQSGVLLLTSVEVLSRSCSGNSNA